MTNITHQWDSQIDFENYERGDKYMALQGGKLAGGNPKNNRVENDYYATNPEAVIKLFDNYMFNAQTILEPCVGGGHIANTINEFFTNERDITAIDIVDRSYPNTIVTDFLTYETDQKFEGIITNPPFSLAQEFIEKSIELLDYNGQIAMFLKIQFLEGIKRKEFFEKHPPKYIYVFRNRMATWNNGQPFDIDEKTGKQKRWATTMCHAWFIWEKENGKMSKSEPIIKWL